MQSSLEYTFKEGKKLAVQAPRNDDILKRTFKTINIELIIILNILCPISTLISSNSSNKGIVVHKSISDDEVQCPLQQQYFQRSEKQESKLEEGQNNQHTTCIKLLSQNIQRLMKKITHDNHNEDEGLEEQKITVFYRLCHTAEVLRNRQLIIQNWDGPFSINQNQQKTDKRDSFRSRKDNNDSLSKNDHHFVQMIELSVAKKKSRAQKMNHQKRKNPRPKENQYRYRNSRRGSYKFFQIVDRQYE